MDKSNRRIRLFAIGFWAALLLGAALGNQTGLLGFLGFALWAVAIVVGAVFFLALVVRRRIRPA